MPDRNQKPRKVIVRKAPSQPRSKERVQKILAAAKRVLASDGLDKLTTNRIAKTAALSIGSLYQYFPNKQTIIHQLYSDWLESIRDLLGSYQQSDLQGETPISIMETIMARIYCPDELKPDEMRYEAELNKAMHLYPELQAIEHKHARQIAAILADIFQRAGMVADKEVLFQLGLYSYELYASYEAMLQHEGTSATQVFEWQKQGLFCVIESYMPRG